MNKVDTALGSVEVETMTSRPCRIDRLIEFNILSEEAKIKMAKRILNEFPEEKWENDIFDGSDNYTGSQFQERCCRKALSLFWEVLQLEEDKK